MNKLYCTARLTRDIEIKEAMTGIQVATIGLAIDNGMANGEKDTLFLSAKAFGKIAENKFQFLWLRFSRWNIEGKHSISFEINWRKK